MPHVMHFNVLHHGNKLFQQWLVDQICKIESTQLRFIKNNQKHLHADTYEAIQQAMQHGRTTSTTMVLVILPSSVTGSPHYMHEKCHDALGLCSRFGKPQLFITATTNLDWPEIKQQLLPGQTVHD